ncbi:MAG: hypothetical protein Q9157_002262 [Trypethelium eluteriae]
MRHIKSLWGSNISDFELLKEHSLRSSPVALKIKFSEQGLTELALGIPRTKKDQQPMFCRNSTLLAWYHQNQIETHTILVRDRISKNLSREGIECEGSTVLVGAEEVGSTIIQILSRLDNQSSLILVGFSLYPEMEWISQKCPAPVSFFTYWVDLQYIASELSGSSAPKLFEVIKAMGISDQPSPTLHRAANDAVRCLVVYSGLTTSDNSISEGSEGRLLVITPKDQKCCFLDRIPRKGKRYPFSARITSADGSHLPSRFDTPLSLLETFRKYEPSAIALNSHGIRKNTGVKVWWVSFANMERLERFKVEMDGFLVDGITVVVESSTHYGQNWLH